MDACSGGEGIGPPGGHLEKLGVGRVGESLS